MSYNDLKKNNNERNKTINNDSFLHLNCEISNHVQGRLILNNRRVRCLATYTVDSWVVVDITV